MADTNTKYGKFGDEIVIDEEFEALLPPLSAEAYRELEKDMLEFGCRDNLILWKRPQTFTVNAAPSSAAEYVLVDGHNRFSVIREHDENLKFGIDYNFICVDFETREEIIEWIIANQLMRRNLTDEQLAYFRGGKYKAIKGRRGGSRIKAADTKGHDDTSSDMEDKALKVAKQYNVSPRTIKRDGKYADAVDAIERAAPGIRETILSGKSGISKKDIMDLANKSDDELRQVADDIVSGKGISKDKHSQNAEPGEFNFEKSLGKAEAELGKIVSNVEVLMEDEATANNVQQILLRLLDRVNGLMLAIAPDYKPYTSDESAEAVKAALALAEEKIAAAQMEAAQTIADLRQTMDRQGETIERQAESMEALRHAEAEQKALLSEQEIQLGEQKALLREQELQLGEQASLLNEQETRLSEQKSLLDEMSRINTDDDAYKLRQQLEQQEKTMQDLREIVVEQQMLIDEMKKQGAAFAIDGGSKKRRKGR